MQYKVAQKTEALKPGEVPNDRTDIICGVFRLKLNALMKFVTKDKIFGVVIGHIHVIEFQKRGLPHAHILLIMREEDKPRTTEDYDKAVCAELPDPTTHPRLWKVVTETMMHGPCGTANPTAGCMKDGKCRFGYPKAYAEETTESDDNSYPIYRRRNNGQTYQKDADGFVYDNRSIAPHNPWLSLVFDCHINMKVCCNITAVKYIYKYIFKGHDRANVSIGVEPVETNETQPTAATPRNEVKEYRQGRYFGASEAAWGLLNFQV